MIAMNKPLTELLSARTPVILAGAMGTELERRGADIGLPLWSANALLAEPETVFRIHLDYIDAGADIIVTNTFRTNRRVFQRAGLPDRSAELTRKAVRLALDARDSRPGKPVLVAGSIAPVEDCYTPELVPSAADLEIEHFEMAERLAENGVDFILIETMTTIREAATACSAALQTGKEVVVSFTCRKDGRLFGGEPLNEAVKAIALLNPAMISLNCISPRYMTPLILQLKASLHHQDMPFAIYGNIGNPDARNGIFVKDIDEEGYVRYAHEWYDLGASMIGGCCGTTPDYISLLRSSFPS